jgi:hypothetical protein
MPSGIVSCICIEIGAYGMYVREIESIVILGDFDHYLAKKIGDSLETNVVIFSFVYIICCILCRAHIFSAKICFQSNIDPWIKRVGVFERKKITPTSVMGV